jgi:uncharacterized protein (TIGR02001 family)
MSILATSWVYADTTTVKADAPTSSISPKEEAKSPLTGNFDITTNYVFRGISQTDNQPAFQGGLTYTFLTPGIYFNLWGSNVNFTSNQGTQATVEVDTIAGIHNEIGENFSYDISFARYNYPNASGANYNELILIGIYHFSTGTSLLGNFGYSPNVYNVHENGDYYMGGISQKLPSHYVYFNDVSIAGTIGHYSLPRNKELYSYNDYSVTIKKKIDNYTLSLQWTGTNGRNNTPPLDDDHLLATVNVDF